MSLAATGKVASRCKSGQGSYTFLNFIFIHHIKSPTAILHTFPILLIVAQKPVLQQMELVIQIGTSQLSNEMGSQPFLSISTYPNLSPKCLGPVPYFDHWRQLIIFSLLEICQGPSANGFRLLLQTTILMYMTFVEMQKQLFFNTVLKYMRRPLLFCIWISYTTSMLSCYPSALADMALGRPLTLFGKG